MGNKLQVLALPEQSLEQVIFVQDRFEGGISIAYDPKEQALCYRVYVHSRFPQKEVGSQEFCSFAKARDFASKYFDRDWEMLAWDFKTERPCEKEGRVCGTGQCETCKKLKADEEASGVKSDDLHTGCGSCGMA